MDGQDTAELLALVEREILDWPGVGKATMDGGQGQGGFWVPPGSSFRFGGRELGHIHVTGVADLPFPRATYDELVAAGRAMPHPAGLCGVLSYEMRGEADVAEVVALFRLNYDCARESAGRREAHEGT